MGRVNPTLPPVAPVVSDENIVADSAVLSGARDLGRAPGEAQLSLAVTLRYRNEAELDHLVQDQETPASNAFHRWLTNEAFNARFAPSVSDYRHVTTSLARGGLRVTQTYANRTVVDVAGSVRAVERYFDTQIDRVADKGYGTRFINVKPAQAPASLRGMLLDVGGLDTRVLVQPDYVTVRKNRGIARRLPRSPHAGSPLFGPVSNQTGFYGYGPLAFSTAYDFPVMHTAVGGSTFDGRGRTAGIVIDADFLDGDIATYLAYFGIRQAGPAIKRVLIHNGPSSPGATAPDSVETTLDVETIVGNAPGTALSVYEIPELLGNFITDAYNKVVSDNAVDAVNSSFGGCDQKQPRAARTWNEIAKQGAAKGITFVAASGDYGGALCTSAPASSPYFIAVGGTSLAIGPGGAWSSETGWSGSGGGVSAVFSVPAWQIGVSGANARGRNVPDVALDANPFTGAAFFFSSTWDSVDNPIGGTSLGAPLLSAAVIEFDQVKNARIGGTAASLYGVFQAQGYGQSPTVYFHDIVQGSNGPFFAGPGYDLVTGIGSVDAWNVASGL